LRPEPQLLIKKKGWIFTGDAYIGGKDRALRQDYDIWQIIRRLFGREMPIACFTMGHFSGKNLVRSYTVNRGGINCKGEFVELIF
jgi:hypothetical protein